jgi:glycerate dehydrogenase
MGLVGMGAIGTRVARIAQELGMSVLAHSRTKKEIAGVRWVELDELFREADVVSLHCPLSSDTHGLVSRARLSTMKPTALLVNAGRGPLVDEHALAEALNRGALRGAALDVLSDEPPSPKNPLLSAKNCIITPHIAWASRAARERLIQISVENVRAFLAGKPVNVVA